MVEQVDVAIVGAGVAGASLAAVLAQRGHRIAIIDPHEIAPADFRAEKLNPPQVAAFDRLGLGATIRARGTPIRLLTVVRFGEIVETRPNRELGIDYADIVAALRDRVPGGCWRYARAGRIDASAAGSEVVLSDGRRIAARLVVLATGLGQALLADIGIRRVPVSAHHCLAVGFDLAISAPVSTVPAMTIFGREPRDRSAYLTLFPIGDRLRANLFVYRRHDEDWARAFRVDPRANLATLVPDLATLLPGFDVIGPCALRPIHLHRSEGHVRDGVVLLGDAFSTTCPTGGTGIAKALMDVERLAALIPGWLATPGMGAEKTARFYADPAKRACDRHAVRMTAHARGMALDPGVVWTLRRRRNYYLQKMRHWLRTRRSRPARPDVSGDNPSGANPSGAASFGADRDVVGAARSPS